MPESLIPNHRLEGRRRRGGPTSSIFVFEVASIRICDESVPGRFRRPPVTLSSGSSCCISAEWENRWASGAYAFRMRSWRTVIPVHVKETCLQRLPARSYVNAFTIIEVPPPRQVKVKGVPYLLPFFFFSNPIFVSNPGLSTTYSGGRT